MHKGYTLVEMLIVSSILVMVVGLTAAIYGFVLRQGGQAGTEAALQLNAYQALEQLKPVLEQAIYCDTPTVSPTGRKCLRVYLPNNYDSAARSYNPTSVNREGLERYVPGDRIWFYHSNTGGLPKDTGSILWRAVKNNDTTPTAGDKNWAMFPNSNNGRISGIANMDYSVDSTNHTVTVTINLSDKISDNLLSDKQGSSSESIVLTRTYFCRNWRQ